MMKSHLHVLLACSLVAAVGCKSHEKPREPTVEKPDCATAVARYVDGPVQQSQLDGMAEEAAKNNVSMTDEQKQANLHLVQARAPMWKSAITKRCIEDQWTPAAIECYATTKNVSDKCGLTAEQIKKLANMPGE